MGSWGKPGLEHLHLVQDDEGVLANGMIIGFKDDKPFHTHPERCSNT